MVVRKRGSTWVYDFRVGGDRYRGSIPEARTKAQAQRVETKKREEVYEGSYRVPRKPLMFREFVEQQYLPIIKEHTRNFSTNAGYQARKLIDAFGDKRIDQISHFEIEKWLLTLRGAYAGVTINHFIKRLNAIYRHAAASGYIEPTLNPMRLVSRVEEVPIRKKRLSREEEQRIALAARNLDLDYVTVAMTILLETGMRPQEFFEMKCDQVSLSEGLIRPISYKIGRRRTTSAQPKERIIPLSDRARVEFEKLHQEALEQKREWIFPYRSIKKAWATVCKQANIEGFWLRWCRDEAASRWAEVGIDEFTIAKLLGHSSPRTSMIYVNDFRNRTVQKMNEINLVTIWSQEEEGRVGDMAVSD